LTQSERDSIREEYPSDQVKLPVGSLLHLHNSDLATNSLGFEQHAALGMILDSGWREPGFHIFLFDTHLYTITGERPFPIPITKMYIMLPGYLVAEEDVKEQLYLSLIRQRLDKEEFGVRPPLWPWSQKRNWRRLEDCHPFGATYSCGRAKPTYLLAPEEIFLVPNGLHIRTRGTRKRQKMASTEFSHGLLGPAKF
jgi:hypothetical protein